MTQSLLRYPTVLFDWGETVMHDDLSVTVPMVEWENIHTVEGIKEVLQYLYKSGRQMILATSASISDEAQIRGALMRAELDSYFSRIYCFKNTGLPKGEAFYRHILKDLQIPLSKGVMVGDSFEKDVQEANMAGLFAVWFNPISDEIRKDELHTTVTSMQELGMFFRSLDQQK
jgi:FMN phosphatase YigB (HAD superfamily)